MRGRTKKILAVVAAVLVAAPVTVYFAFPQLVLLGAMHAERGRAGLSAKHHRVGGHEIHYLEGGRFGGPPLLLLHGFGGDKDNWTRMGRYVGERYWMIAPDLPGFGQSSRIPDASYDITSQVARLHAFVQSMALGPFHLAGNSMGGHLAGAYAARHPALVRSVAFFANAGVRSPVEAELSRRLARGENPLLVGSPAEFDRMLAFVFEDPPILPGPVRAHFARRAIEARNFLVKIWRDVHERPQPLEPLLGTLKMPAFVLWGDRDRLLHPSTVDVMKREIPHARVVVMKRCGHVPMAERPEETASHYLSFLDGISSSSE